MLAIIRINVILGCVLLTGCGKKDCSSIDMSALNDIKLAPKIQTQATNLDDFMRELDQRVHRTHKLIIRCRAEQDFEQDNVLPGVLLWISDSWHLRNDTSGLGRIFFEHGIDPWERTRVAGILFHRHLNEQPLQATNVLGDAHVRSEYQGRVQSTAALKQLNDSERKRLLHKIAQADSAISKLNVLELSLSREDRMKKDLDAAISLRHRMMISLDKLLQDVEDKVAITTVVRHLGDSAFSGSFSGFENLSLPKKLIQIETVRLASLAKEQKALAQWNIPQSTKVRPALPGKGAH